MKNKLFVFNDLQPNKPLQNHYNGTEIVANNELNDSTQNSNPLDWRLLSVGEVVRILGISERSVWRMIHDDELPVIRLRGCLRIHSKDLERYIARRRRVDNA